MTTPIEALRELVAAHDGFSARQDVGRMPAAWANARAALARPESQPESRPESMLDERAEFEAFVERWTGRGMAYHLAARTWGLGEDSLAFACWQAAGAYPAAEALRKLSAAQPAFAPDALDAKRYRWIRKRNPGVILGVAWGVKEACLFDLPDAAIDAAMKAKP